MTLNKQERPPRLHRRDLLKQAAISAASLACTRSAFGLAAPQPPRRRPNILYIMTDQQPISCVGAYGSNPTIRTPHLDRLAAQSCQLNHAYVAGMPCAPSRACQFTGRYVHNHRLIINDAILEDDVPTLGDICKAAGYRTAYFGKWHLGGFMRRGTRGRDGYTEWHWARRDTKNGWVNECVEGGPGDDFPQHGFDTWAGGWMQYRHWLRDRGLGDLVDKHSRLGGHYILPPGKYDTIGTSTMPAEYHVETFIAEQAQAFIAAQAGADTPWCAVASFYGPHPPVAPPEPYDEMYRLDDVTLPPSYRDPLHGKPETQDDLVRYRFGAWTDDEFKDYIRKYWGTVTYIDRQIGRVVTTLEDTGQLDNTIIVFTSDHGNMCGEHGMIFKTLFTCYEELVHVPLLIRIPDLNGFRHIDALTSHVDVLPTILDAAGIAPTAQMDGASMTPLLRGDVRIQRDEVFCDVMNISQIVRDQRYKYALHWNSEYVDELYDLQNDPLELHNVAYEASGKRAAEDMRRKVITHLDTTNHPYAKLIEQKAVDPSRRRMVMPTVWSPGSYQNRIRKHS